MKISFPRSSDCGEPDTKEIMKNVLWQFQRGLLQIRRQWLNKKLKLCNQWIHLRSSRTRSNTVGNLQWFYEHSWNYWNYNQIKSFDKQDTKGTSCRGLQVTEITNASLHHWNSRTVTFWCWLIYYETHFLLNKTGRFDRVRLCQDNGCGPYGLAFIKLPHPQILLRVYENTAKSVHNLRKFK
jgi:hypothetical protein